MAQSTSAGTLPNEIIIIVMGLVDVPTLVRCLTVCHNIPATAVVLSWTLTLLCP